jgi:hypothetical protein
MWKRLVNGWDAGLCDVKLYSVDGEMMCGSVGVWEWRGKGARGRRQFFARMNG